MKQLVPLSAIAILLIGCTNDERMVEMAKQHDAQQAEQNLRMADLQKQVAEGSKRLVETEAQSRDKLLAMQDNVRADQATVGKQRDKLECDRREIAEQRNRDPIVAAAIVQVGLVLASLLPLVLAGYLVYSMKHTANEDEAVVTELLVTELVSDRPRLLGPTPRLPQLLLDENVEATPT